LKRRLFEERNFNVTGKVVPYQSFKLFIDKPEGFNICEEHRAKIISTAEEWLEYEFPVILATDYMMFKRTGDRTVYGGKYGKRRQAVMALALAEYFERQGRFTDKLIDVIWMTLEETTWVASAHNPSKEGVNTCLPYAHSGKVDYIDLFSATIAATLSFIYYLCGDILDGVTTLINERILYELNRRILEPFLDDYCILSKMGWTGVKGNKVNNWNPWIVSNVLTVCALTERDPIRREAVVRRAMKYLDNFTSVYHDDGGCDEGPSYWGAAGGALFDCCNILYDLTDGYVDIFDDELLRKMGEYEAKVAIHGNRFLNFADSPSKLNPSGGLIYDWGCRCNSEMLKTFGLSRLNGGLISSKPDINHIYRYFRLASEPKHEAAEYIAPTKFYLDGIVVAAARETEATDKGLYLALKGGANNESHNHNDIGNVIVFADGKPIFIDAGSGTYTRRTFSKDRYTIWAMRSDYHNCATVNGVIQEKGAEYHSEDEEYDETSGKLKISLKRAYPESADIAEYTRSAVLENATAIIEDDIKFNNEGDIVFNYLCVEEPSDVTEDSFVLSGRRITFDASLEFKYETVDCSWVETAKIPTNWGVESIYRITLTSKDKIKEKKYVLTVK